MVFRHVAGLIGKLRRLKRTGLSAKVAIVSNDLKWRLYRRRHPDAAYSDFYAHQITLKLDRGQPHKTLGRGNFKKYCIGIIGSKHDAESFSLTGLLQFEHLLSLGLHPDDVVVDFGCGSLRVGQHLIKYLHPGHYWGFDVTDRFFADGLALIGETVVDEKRPNLRKIGPDTLAEARRSSPRFVVSIAVLKHVPQNEIDVYFDHLMSLVGRKTKLLISFSAGPQGRRLLGKSWYNSIEFVEQQITLRRPDASFSRKCKEKSAPGTFLVYLSAQWNSD